MPLYIASDQPARAHGDIWLYLIFIWNLDPVAYFIYVLVVLRSILYGIVLARCLALNRTI
jgi:hypothetical protein